MVFNVPSLRKCLMWTVSCCLTYSTDTCVGVRVWVAHYAHAPLFIVMSLERRNLFVRSTFATRLPFIIIIAVSVAIVCDWPGHTHIPHLFTLSHYTRPLTHPQFTLMFAHSTSHAWSRSHISHICTRNHILYNSRHTNNTPHLFCVCMQPLYLTYSVTHSMFTGWVSCY